MSAAVGGGQAAWQTATLSRLGALGYDGFIFGPGVRWWVMKDGAKVAGPFASTEAFDEWLDREVRA
jgi:hypothetical protein